MKRRFFASLLCAMLCATLFTSVAHADMGPKPSVRITLEGLDGRLCYGTLLSEETETGPARVWNGDPAKADHKGNDPYAMLDEDIWQAFVDCAAADPDGYHFLQWGWRVDETEQLNWTYYPPQRFKVALYYPETGEFRISDIYECYAFHSYFAAEADDKTVTLRQYYDHTTDLLALSGRILGTVAVELLLAAAFGLLKKRYWLPIAAVNLLTQAALNIGLYVTAFRSGFFDFTLILFLLELVIFAVEAVLLCLLLRRSEPRPTRGRIILYAACANTVSFVLGLYLAQVLPWLF
ncbi:MAG: hypothetical protein E7469_07360 [Ruminococcaceae bacterium]|nr:hypothetical protein [Oscillospiraceae bacterium]